MAWAAIGETDILSKMTAGELEAFRAADVSGDQGDPVAAAIATVTAKVRGYIRAWEANELGAAGTIPPELLGAALDLLVVEIQSRAGGMIIDAGETRKRAAEAALALLRDVAAGRFAIEDPDTGETGVGSALPRVTERTRALSRDKQAGI